MPKNEVKLNDKPDTRFLIWDTDTGKPTRLGRMTNRYLKQTGSISGKQIEKETKRIQVLYREGKISRFTEVSMIRTIQQRLGYIAGPPAPSAHNA